MESEPVDAPNGTGPLMELPETVEIVPGIVVPFGPG
jgi:hypothetical protein